MAFFNNASNFSVENAEFNNVGGNYNKTETTTITYNNGTGKRSKKMMQDLDTTNSESVSSGSQAGSGTTQEDDAMDASATGGSTTEGH